MCYAVGSIDQATGTCPMCKVFKPSGRCPHVKETCRNRALHPRCDVVYLKNAEVQTFNGCGFCKWARSNTNPKLSGYQNPGWPGCCRAPNPSEHKLIQAADWPTVSLVHRVPIPSEIKAILETITGQRTANPLALNTGSIRGLPSSQPPSLSRRTSSSITIPGRGDSTPIKSVPVTIPGKSRSGGSPQQLPTTLTSGARNAAVDSISCSLPNASAMDQVQNMLRRPLAETQEKRRDNSRDAKKGSPSRRSIELIPSRKSVEVVPSRKSIDLGGNSSRRISTSQQRPSISAATASTSVNKVTVDAPTAYRSALTSSTNALSASTPVPNSRTSVDREKINTDSVRRRKTSLESAVGALSISSGSSASSSDSGDGSETTVVSDGGFTDYLSDDSDVELQRQAEIKAALLAHSYMEEQEFKAARQQLANIDLRPPKSWTSNVHSTPRSQNSAPNSLGAAAAATYGPTFYGSSSSQSYIAASSGSHSRS